MDKQTIKFFREQHQTQGQGDWWRSSQRRQAKLRASKIDLEQPYEKDIKGVFKVDIPRPFDVSKCKLH